MEEHCKELEMLLDEFKKH
jgi:hypothetical protein